MKKINKFTTFAPVLAKKWNNDTPTEIEIPSYCEEERLEKEEDIENEMDAENNESNRRFHTFKDFTINEARVPRNERVELYKDENIIVVVPLTHRALQKYATNCQWCINDDSIEWKDYHQGKHAVIIQRKPKKEKIGITGQPIASEILMMDRWDNGNYKFQDVCEILGYQFKDEQEMGDYYVTVLNDINNFATNIVYYSPENGIYDMEDNPLWGFNIEINDIPNVTPEVIKIMDDYLKKREEPQSISIKK